MRTAKTPNERVAEFSSETIEVKVQMDQGKTRERNIRQREGSAVNSSEVS